VQYLRRCVDFALGVGAPLVIVVPSAVSKVAPVGFADDPREDPGRSAAAFAQYATAKLHLKP